MTKKIDEREFLRQAADYIAEHGWTQGSLFDGVGNADPDQAGFWENAKPEELPHACAMGALYAVEELAIAHYLNGSVDARTTTSRALSKAGALLWEYVEQNIDMRGVTCVPEWNDHPSTTAEDVILAMKKAAG